MFTEAQARTNLRCRGRQAGQAMVEALLGLTVLIALWTLVVLLGKYQSIAQSAIAASRSLAFECTVSDPPCTGTRPPAGSDPRVRSAHFFDSAQSSAVHHRTKPLWRDRAGGVMFDPLTDVDMSISAARFDAGESVGDGQRLAGISDPASLIAGRAGPGRFGLRIDDGIRNAKIRVDVQSHRPTHGFDRRLLGMALSIRANTAILVDPWNASGPEGPATASVAARVLLGRRLDVARETMLDAAYAPAIALLRLADALGLESGADSFDRSALDVDVVPSDRVGP